MGVSPRGEANFGEERFAVSVGVLAPEVVPDDVGWDCASDSLNFDTFDGLAG